MYCVDGRHDAERQQHRQAAKQRHWRSRKAKRKTSARVTRWRRGRRKIVTDKGRQEVGPELIVPIAECSAVAVAVELPREETSHGIDMDGFTDCTEPRHPRAIPTFLEAVALWQGQPVRAALCADAGGYSCDSRLCREASFDWDDGGALYSVLWVPAGAHRQRRHRLSGLGSFSDLERLITAEVAR